jgi:23S rRNA pseudouridine1911/1915/1917 synthase
MNRAYHVRVEQAGKSLAEFLPMVRRELSIEVAQAWIAAGRVMIHGAVCQYAGRPLRKGDVIHVLDPPNPETNRSPQTDSSATHGPATATARASRAKGQATPRPQERHSVEVLYRDEHLIAVTKPAGVTTLRHGDESHSSGKRRNRQATLLDILSGMLAPKASTHGTRREPKRVRAVHRLDRETSGVIVFALSDQAQSALELLFRHHDVQRTYRAIVVGQPIAQTIESFLVEDRGDGRRGSTTIEGEGQRAITHLQPLQAIGPFWSVQCRLETGRTHQIRIHLAERGHPICGDRLYAPAAVARSAPRLALHAVSLGFRHPITGRDIDVRSPFPDDLLLWARSQTT